MNAFWPWVASPLGGILSKWTGLLALGWVVHGCLRERHARWRLILWRSLLVFSLALPVVSWWSLSAWTIRVPESPTVVPTEMDSTLVATANISPATQRLFCVLIAADSPEAIKALGQSLRKLGPLQHRNMIESIGGYIGGLPLPKQNVATQAAVEAVLVAELDDTEAVPSEALYRYQKREKGQGLRYCDLAEAQLAHRSPDKYNFDLFAPWSSATNGGTKRARRGSEPVSVEAQKNLTQETQRG
jgi:hypothetical protein